MQYICPYEFLGLETQALRHEELYGLQYQVEGDYRGRKVIAYKGRKVTKKLALWMVEAMKDPDFREKTWMLFRRPNLKQFLETGEERWFWRLERETDQDDRDFVAFVSRFFAGRLNDLLAAYLNGGEWEKAEVLIHHREWLAPQDHFEAFTEARYLIWWRAKELEQLGEHQGLTNLNKARYIQPGLRACISGLASLYPSLTDYYAASLGEAIVATVNRQQNLDLGVELILATLTLPVNSDLADALGKLKNQLREVVEKRQPLRKFLMDLIPIASLRKGRWKLWEKDLQKESVSSWVARIAIALLPLLMVGWLIYKGNTSTDLDRAKNRQTMHLPMMANYHRQLLPQLRHALDSLAMAPSTAPIQPAADLPLHPYRDLLYPKRYVAPDGLTFRMRVQNNTDHDQLILAYNPYSLHYPILDLLLPVGEWADWRLPFKGHYVMLIYEGCNWVESPVHLPGGAFLPGYFATDAQVIRCWVNPQGQPYHLPFDLPLSGPLSVEL